MKLNRKATPPSFRFLSTTAMNGNTYEVNAMPMLQEFLQFRILVNEVSTNGDELIRLFFTYYFYWECRGSGYTLKSRDFSVLQILNHFSRGVFRRRTDIKNPVYFLVFF